MKELAYQADSWEEVLRLRGSLQWIQSLRNHATAEDQELEAVQQYLKG